MNWDEYKQEFEWDGSLRDLYIFNTDISDWQQLVSLLQDGKYNTTFKVDNQAATMPDQAAEIFQQCNQTPVLMSIEVRSIIINCHFFTEQEIEFDIDPREITSEEHLNQVFEFMRTIGSRLRKEMIMTPENYRKEVIFRYVPETGEILYVRPRR